MPRRRVMRTREQKSSKPYVRRHMMEPLEARQLLHTMTGSGVLEYKDAEDNIVRLRFHNLQGELVFARVDENTNQLTLSEPTLAFQDEPGKDLFTIYIAQAGPGAYITAAEVPPITANVRPMQPFTGAVDLTIVGRTGLQPVTTIAGSGAIYLGAKTRDTPANIPNEANRPFLTDQFFGMGILGPRPNGRLTAGLITEPGVDLDKFFWGGAISGQVSLGGSVDTFYAGSVLTGDTRGDGGTVSIPSNFFVAGDIRELIVMGSIGTHEDSAGGLPIYESGFDMEVRGTIGRVQSHGHIIGNIRAINDPAAPRLRYSQREIENEVLPGNRGSLTHYEGTDQRDRDFDKVSPDPFPRLGDNQAEFDNDTFETAQFLGSFNSKALGDGSINLNGTLQHIPEILDEVDYYGVALMAGQTIDVRLLAPLLVVPDFGELPEDQAAAFLTIYDPDGRLVASDTNNVQIDATINRLFQFTADRPGVYRFAVNVGGEVTWLANIDYQLQIQKVGVLSIGAIASTGEIFGETSGQHQIAAHNGDLGVLFAGQTLAYAGAPAPFDISDVFVDGGNMRAVDAAQIGFAQNDNGFGPNFEVYGGDVGVIRGRTGLVNLETVFVHDNRRGIGGSVQLIEAPGSSLFMELHADKMLGVARAANMATVDPSIINVNADKRGGDGIIDLIDVSGDLGLNGPGGPQITTGPGGNVRYMHVGGVVNRDVFFGGGSPDVITYLPGETASFTDDSGTQMLLVPVPSRRNDPFGNPTETPGALSVTRYGIRDKGGNVLVNLASTRGVQVVANGQSGRGSAEIGEINANGLGTLIEDDTGNLANNGADDELQLETSGDDLEVQLEGNATIDVYEIVGGNFTDIQNHTDGEIVNVQAQSIGSIEAATLGLAKSHTRTAVGGVTIINTTPGQAAGEDRPDGGPFDQQRIGIQVQGDIISARARQGLGNFIVDGSIQELHANSDGRNTRGVHEGINAPIMTRPGGVATGGGGEIRWVQIGEGILSSGTGQATFSGIFAHSRIGTIVNQGEGSDIRGDVVSKGENLPTVRRQRNDGVFEIVPLAPIGAIDLDDGAILGADILVATLFQNAWELGGGGRVAPDNGFFSDEPTFEIEIISLEGKGGIMASSFFANDIGDVEVKNGFGIFQSSFVTVASGGVANVSTDGFGIRSVVLDGGGDLLSLTARGSGRRLAATDFTSSVRYSERMKFDPFSGYALSEINDLHMYLGTSARFPIRLTTDYGRGGVIDDTLAIGSGNLGWVNAHQIKSSEFSFASQTNSVVARDYIDTLTIRSGRLNFLQASGDVHWADWRIAGPVGTVRVGGTWRGTSVLAAEGPNGQIGTFGAGDMWGALISSNDINEVLVTRDLGSTGSFNDDDERLSAGIDAGGDLHTLRVGGSVMDGATVFVDDRLGTAVIDGDVEEGATIDVERLGSLRMGGQIFGDFIIRAES